MSIVHLENPLSLVVHFEKLEIIKKIGGTMKPHVCTNDFGNVHLISGNPEGDEGYSQSVVYFTFSRKGLYSTSLLHITHLFEASLFKCFLFVQ